ncbi:hypothetical protein BN59_03635 [Legionella massiliensis]|uniref:Uncharacterized protein n=1 Tax=Legionella massiliensis TaxID=1034943 RepID=A0A078L261_9GAMM|nr:hypothetical protein [Legionella massiliensis]CDZ79317.1 hypothetical protein BN59_03635 [Legionella massiliensis]CEE15055.1 hypothetical protein BN1094_03635 [Legionella massiliensis]
MSIFNPLKNLLESKRYPFANAQRTTFWQKLLSALTVFSGYPFPGKPNSPEPYKYVHFGVYDYLTLGIPFILHQLLISLVRWLESPPLKIFFTGIFLLTELPRIAFGATMALVCLPFVAIAHALASPAGEPIKAAILAYQVETDDCKIVVANTAINKKANNTFFFIHNENKLIYKDITGNLRNIPLKDVVGLRKELGIGEGYQPFELFGYPSAYISREKLKQFLSNETTVLNSYHSLGQLLDAKGYALEDLAESKVEIVPADKETKQTTIRLTFNNDNKQLTSFTLSLSKSKDLTLFGNLRRLNVACVESNIEESAYLSQNLPA